MMLFAQAAMAEPTGAARVIQFAAILLETGGAVLIAILFAIASRASIRRNYFSTWTLAWYCVAVAISAVTARYFLFTNVTISNRPDNDWLVRSLYWLYAAGKIGFWLLVWRGVTEYTKPVASRLWPLGAAAAAYATFTLVIARDLNDILVIQAPVAVVTCALGAFSLLNPKRSRRTAGSATTAVVLLAIAALWIVYFFVFGSAIKLFTLPINDISRIVLNYNSYADMLLLVVLGFAMLMVFMEDSRERISAAESRLASMVTAAPDPILTIDGEQRVIGANVVARRVFGPAASGARASALVAPADRGRLQEAIARFASGDKLSLVVGDDEHVHALRPDGTSFTAEFTISRLHDADLSVVLLVVHDTTGKSELEERRRQASTMEAVRQLAGGLAHDFNNLLTTIIGRSQIIARTLPAASPVREDVTQIEQAASSAARLSRGLLALSRREPLDPERLAIDTVVSHTESRARSLLRPGITYALQLGADGAHAHVDRARLEAAILAVVRNAIEAVGEHGDVVIETSRVLGPKHLGATTEAACIAICDTGPGFSAPARTHLFEPFFSTKADGRGLGLATTWAFAHQSGGTVDVESGTKGTTVRLLFPIAAAATVPVAAVPPTLTIVPSSPRQRLILVAEDEESVRRSVKIFLEKAGFSVVAAADGVEALAAFEQSPDEFGLLLTDVMMPQMGGRELAERLMTLRPDLRVVFMSGFLRDPEVLRMVNDRRVRFLAKPFDIDALVGMVRGELEHEGSHAA